MNVHEVKSIETKSILSRLKSKDNYWGIAYNMQLSLYHLIDVGKQYQFLFVEMGIEVGEGIMKESLHIVE